MFHLTKNVHFFPVVPITPTIILFPCQKTQKSTTAKTLLSFVNEKTKKKFLITNSLEEVCKELGWNKDEVEEVRTKDGFTARSSASGSEPFTNYFPPSVITISLYTPP
jgi:hypothetical protein